jgi:hypothetical protein
VVDSEDALPNSIHKLGTVTSKYGLNVSKNKMKTMAFKERDPVRIKIVINNNVTEQTNKHF